MIKFHGQFGEIQMILMPYYGVKLDKNFVHKNQMLDNKNIITIHNGDKDVYFFGVPAICGTDKLVTSKELESIKGELEEILESVMKQQNNELSQTLCNGEREFFVTVMDY